MNVQRNAMHGVKREWQTRRQRRAPGRIGEEGETTSKCADEPDCSPVQTSKRSNPSTEGDTSDWERNHRLEQNRLSAKRSRQRKKILVEELQRRVGELEEEYTGLLEENQKLTREANRRKHLTAGPVNPIAFRPHYERNVAPRHAGSPQGRIHGGRGAQSASKASRMGQHQMGLSKIDGVASTNSAMLLQVLGPTSHPRDSTMKMGKKDASWKGQNAAARPDWNSSLRGSLVDIRKNAQAKSLMAKNNVSDTTALHSSGAYLPSHNMHP